VTPPRRAAVAFIFVTLLLDSLALGVSVPVLPKLVLRFESGNSADAATVFGLFGTAFSAMQFLFAPVLGALSDRLGRRPVILLALFGLGLDYVVMALAPSLGWLFAGRLLSGACAANFSTASAYIADVTPPEERAKSFGMLGAAFGVGFVIGPALGGVLGDIDLRLPFWVAAALTLANAAYGFWVLPESLPPERRSRFDWRQANPIGALRLVARYRHVLGLVAVLFLYRVAHDVQPSMWVLYTDYRYHWGARTVGLMLALMGVLGAITSATLVGPIVRTLGERKALVFGLLCGTTGFAIYGLAPTSLLFTAGIPFVAGWFVSGPAAQTLLTSRVDPSEQGRLQGAIASVQGVASVIAPGLFTGLFAAAIARPGAELPGAPFLLAAALLLASAAVAWRATRSGPPRRPTRESADEQRGEAERSTG
jgi:DHA1 family tetracycline resistance protein-like MFS transporter